jgi:outer membrane protein assembly factor BamB
MLLRILRVTAAVVVLIGVTAAVLYQFFGLRIVLDGGGTPRVRVMESSEAQAARIEAHRAAQRAASAATERTGMASSQPDPLAAAKPQTDAGGAAGVDGAAGNPSTASSSGATGGIASAPEAVPSGPGLAVTPASLARLSGAPWPDFRGPRRDGVYREGRIRTNWPAGGLTPLWKQPAGGGYASFVVADGRAFTIEQRGAKEVVAAYDVGTGRELWTNIWEAEFRESMGGDGPRATPTWSDGRVYALGAIGELRALDAASGQVRWRTNILNDAGASNLTWGMAAAPLVVGNTLIVLPGGAAGASVLAYDRVTGRRLWSALQDQASYASPVQVTLGGVPQILVFTAARLVGLSLDGGTVLWDYAWPGPNGINAAQPLVLDGDRVYISSGYGMGAAVLQIAKGDSGFSAREVWRNTRMKNRFASAVVHDGVIYGLDESILAAVDAATGEQKWKGGRYGYGQLLLADGHLIVLTEDGELALVKANPARHEEIARFQVLNGKTWNPPAMAGGYLLVRNLAEMAAFDLRVP